MKVSTTLLITAFAITALLPSSSFADIAIPFDLNGEAETTITTENGIEELLPERPITQPMPNPVERQANQEIRVENRSNLQLERQANIELRQEARVNAQVDRQETREANQANRQEERAVRQEVRVENRVERTEERQARISERKAERENRVAQRQATREERKLEREAAITERLALTEERRAENRARFSAQAQARVQQGTERLTSTYIDRLNRAESIYAKVETRIEDLAERGANISAANSILSEARAILDAAADNVIEAQVTSNVVLEADDARALWSETQANFQAAKDEYARLKTLYREIVAEIRQLEAEIRENSRTSISSDTETNTSAAITNETNQ